MSSQPNVTAKPDMLPHDTPFTNEADINELPHVLDGSFTWLTRTPTHAVWAIGDECADVLPHQLASVMASAEEYGLTLPDEFVTFIRTPALHRHLRSATACYLNIAGSVLPFAEGFLIRFLSDQQDCAFWYLYTNADGSDHCVVMSLEYFDADDEADAIDETDFYFLATSFEAFLSRFWIENEIMFSDLDGTPPPDVDPRFLKLYAQ